jgi:hypothetical protein
MPEFQTFARKKFKIVKLLFHFEREKAENITLNDDDAEGSAC